MLCVREMAVAAITGYFDDVSVSDQRINPVMP